MKWLWFLILVTGISPAFAQSANHEILWLVSVREDNGVKQIFMRSEAGRYVFECDLKAAGCVTPIPRKPYWLLTDSSPVGKMDLAWLKYWYVEYYSASNVGLIPAWKEWWNGDGNFMERYGEVGAYWLSSFTVTK